MILGTFRSLLLRDRSAGIAVERLFWVTVNDRIRTRDSRVLWWGR